MLGDRYRSQGETLAKTNDLAQRKAVEKTSAFTVEEHLFYLIGQIFAKREQAMVKRLRPLKMTYNAMRALLVLLERDGCTLGELTDITVIERTTLSRTVDSLKRRQIVRCVPRPTDRRHVEVYITDKGRRLIEGILPMLIEQNREAVAGMNGDDVFRLRALLRDVIANLDRLSAD
jgi:MarR family transcriptional regulator, lower aerobic nicotinate degradation pathway regulator